MKTVLLTGVTGQIGSELASHLQNRGYRILYLIRSRGEETAELRLVKLLKTIRHDMDIAIDGDITMPYAGLSYKDFFLWSGKIDMILHGAAAISFEEKDAKEVWTANYTGTKNMLELADVLSVKEFHYISTAYISGSSPVFSETDLDVGQISFNHYERSKMAAEKLVHAWTRGSFSIYRLPTVLGSSIDGKVLTFHSYYGFFIPFWRMLKSWQRRWESKREDCLINGVNFNDEGVMNIPLFIDCSETAILNMVTVDWVAEMMSELLTISATRQTYHLVHHNPITVRTVIDISLRHLRISGVRYDVAEGNELSPLLRKIQVGISDGTKIYQQYVKHGSIFKFDNLVKTLGERYVYPKAVDDDLLRIMLDYAKKANFASR